MAVTWKKLAYETDVITKALLTAKGDIIYASAASTPAALAIGADNTVLTVNVDVPNWEAPTVGAHTLDDHDPAAASVDFNDQQAVDFILHTVANAAARPGAVVGKAIFQTDELAVYVCTSAV